MCSGDAVDPWPDRRTCNPPVGTSRQLTYPEASIRAARIAFAAGVRLAVVELLEKLNVPAAAVAA